MRFRDALGRFAPMPKDTEMLMKHLNPEQQRTYQKFGYFEFLGKEGHKFRLYSDTALRKLLNHSGEGRLVLMHRDGYTTSSTYGGRNIWAKDRNGAKIRGPLGLLALKLAIESDERTKDVACPATHSRALVHATDNN